MQAFRCRLDQNLLALRTQILAGEVAEIRYLQFIVREPKERLISAAPFWACVLQHAIMNECGATFERLQLYDSYACRTGKGTYAALARAASYQRRYAWYLKLDVRKYFYSISHRLLKLSLRRCFKEEKLLNLFGGIIDSYATLPERGVPIGNLTSQYFANHYLAAADRCVKEHLRIPGYARYMDDMVLWSDDKCALLEAGKYLSHFISEKQDLQLHPFCLNRTAKGLPFLGYVVYPHKLELARNSQKRFAAKMKAYYLKLERGEWTQQDYQRHATPLIAFTEHANARQWRSGLLQKLALNSARAEQH